MERLELGRRNEKVLPVNVNGQDADLAFDADDIVVSTTILAMADEIDTYQREGVELSKGKPSLKELRAFVERGLELCRSLSERMAGIFPQWKGLVGDGFLKISDYEAVIISLAGIIQSRRMERKVSEEMEGER